MTSLTYRERETKGGSVCVKREREREREERGRSVHMVCQPDRGSLTLPAACNRCCDLAGSTLRFAYRGIENARGDLAVSSFAKPIDKRETRRTDSEEIIDRRRVTLISLTG